MEAADFGYPPAIYKLGYCYEHGLLGLEVNPVRLVYIGRIHSFVHSCTKIRGSRSHAGYGRMAYDWR
jgi:hypothetical protein